MEKKEKIVLKDGTEIEIENGASQNCIQVMLTDLDGFAELHAKFTENNLESYQIKNADGLICARLENKYLDETVVKKRDDGYLISFNLDDVDMVQKQLASLTDEMYGVKAGQEIQDGAIADLGDAVGKMMEGGKE